MPNSAQGQLHRLMTYIARIFGSVSERPFHLGFSLGLCYYCLKMLHNVWTRGLLFILLGHTQGAANPDCYPNVLALFSLAFKPRKQRLLVVLCLSSRVWG